MPDLEAALMRLAAEKLEAGEEIAIVTLLSTNIAQEARPGTMMLVDQFGEIICGSLGDRPLQTAIRQEAQKCMSRGVSRRVTLQSETGLMELFIKVSTSKDQLIIVGSGSLVQDVYSIALILGYYIIIVDQHPETLNRERYPQADELLLGDIVEQLNNCHIDENTSIVICSHHHEADQTALKAVVYSPARYIGILGNKHKVVAHFSMLNSMGVPEDLINRVHVPIGLDLGGQKTSEIALGIMAEVQAIKHGRPGGFLTIKQERKGIVQREELF